MADAYYEKGFKAKVTIPEAGQGEIAYQGEAKPGYLEDHNSSPKFKKIDFEADGHYQTQPRHRQYPQAGQSRCCSNSLRR